MMAGALTLYVVAHSPLRSGISRAFGGGAQGCYFVCGHSLTLEQAVDSGVAFVAILAALLAGWAVADWFGGAPYEWYLAFGLSSLAFIVVPAAAIGGIGEWVRSPLLRPPSGPAATAIPAVLIAIIAVYHGWRPHRIRTRFGRPGSLVLLLGSLAGTLLVASSVISLMHPPNGYDALAYHAPMAVYFWREGTLAAFLARGLGGSALANPGMAELWYGLLRIAGGDGLADLGQLPFAFLGAAAVHAVSRRLGLNWRAALLASCSFLLAPIVVVQIGMQLNDLAGGALLMVTMALACAPASEWNGRRAVLLGLGLGLAATTKLVVLPGVAAVALFLAVQRIRTSMSARPAGLWCGIVLLAFAIVAAPWWARNVVRYGNPVYPAALPLIGRGFVESSYVKKDIRFVPSAKAWALYPLVEPQNSESGYGALFVVGGLPGFLLAALRRRSLVVLFVLVAFVMLPAWWLLTRHEPRFLLALFGFGFAFLPWTLVAVPRNRRTAAGVLLAAAAIFSALVTVDQALMPLAREPTARSQFYDAVWGLDPVAAALPDSEGLLVNEGYAPLTYTNDYPLLGRSQSRIIVPVDTGASSAAIVAKMRRAHLRYAYVATSSGSRSVVEQKYNRSRFELVHASVGRVFGKEILRYLYRLKNR
jgi:hypothetical protein